MLLIVWKVLYSILLTLGIIVGFVLILYYIMFLFSLLAGLFGWYTVSGWFRSKMTTIKNRLHKVYNILLRRK